MKSAKIAVCLVALNLAACASRSPAPIVDRTGGATRTAPAPAAAAPAPAAGREATRTYTVQRGDTLRSIAASQGVSVTDLVRWNALANPNVIEVGQVLRLAPPQAAEVAAAGASAGAVASAAPVSPAGSVEARPLDAPTSGPGSARTEPPKPAEPISLPSLSSSPSEAAASFARGVRLEGGYVDKNSPLSRREAISRLVEAELARLRNTAPTSDPSHSSKLKEIRYLQSRLAGGCE